MPPDEIIVTPRIRSALVTPEHYRGMEEWYIAVIECPKCNQKLPAKHTNFCSGCGVPIKLSVSVRDRASSDW